MPRARHVRFQDALAATGSTEPRADEDLTPLDPAALVAQAMVKRHLASSPDLEDAVRCRGSITVVRTLSADWTSLVATAWEKLVHGGREPASGRPETWGLERDWISFMPSADRHFPIRSAREEDDLRVVEAIWRSLTLVGFSHDPVSTLPPDLVNAADHDVRLSPLVPVDIENAVRDLKDSPSSGHLDEEAASRVTPRMLRLACRPGQDADAYLARLRSLLSEGGAPQAATTPGSPKDNPTLDRLHGMDEAVTWGRSLAADLREYGAGRLPWRDVDRGCLLSGPPGCGKTMYARALAATCNAKLVCGSYSRWLGTGRGYQGDLFKAMRSAFDEAKSAAPAILFIDEVDSFPNRTNVSHYPEWHMEVVNALLTEIDGVQGREGVVVLAACNHPHLLDPALTRSGRLDRHIRLQLPHPTALEGILREHLGDDLAGVDLAAAALIASGASGADCEAFARAARRRAREAGRRMVPDDLLTEIQGEEQPPDAELRLAAVHEAGHALAECELHPGMLQSVALRATGGSGGVTSYLRRSGFTSAADVHGRLVALLAGRAAEEVVLGAPSSGSGGPADSDLGQATVLAATAFASLGFDELRGLTWSGHPSPTTLPRVLAADPMLAARTRLMLDVAYREALELMRHRRAPLEALVDLLVDRRALDGVEVAEVIARHPSPSVPETSGALPGRKRRARRVAG